MGEVFGVEGLGEVAGVLVFDDVGQAAGVEGDHRGGAGVGFGSCLAECFLARRHHDGIGGAVERAQAEVVVQVTGVVDGKPRVRTNSPQHLCIQFFVLLCDNAGIEICHCPFP